MRNVVVICFSIAVALFVGATGGYWFHAHRMLSVPDQWYVVNEIPLKGTDSGLGFTSEAINSDIPLPSVTHASARMKFRRSIGPSDGIDRLALGYIITIDVDTLDTQRIPERYKQTKNYGRFTQLPLDQVAYEIHIVYALFDEDGFKLAEVDSPTHYIFSGRRNTEVAPRSWTGFRVS